MNGSSKSSWSAHRLKAMGLSELWHRIGESWEPLSDAAFAKRLAGSMSCEVGGMTVSPRYGQLERSATLDMVDKGKLRSQWTRAPSVVKSGSTGRENNA